MPDKPSKVLIIGSGPIVIGQACCHSEGAERLKNLRKMRPFALLRVTGGVVSAERSFATLRVTEKGLRVTIE